MQSIAVFLFISTRIRLRTKRVSDTYLLRVVNNNVCCIQVAEILTCQIFRIILGADTNLSINLHHKINPVYYLRFEDNGIVVIDIKFQFMKRIQTYIVNAVLLVILLVVQGCNIDAGSGSVGIGTDESSMNKSGNEKITQATVYSIPSPFQTPTLLKVLDIDYHSDLVSKEYSATSYTTSYERAVNLGVSMVDLGYVYFYDQYQPAVNHMAKIKKLIEDLNLNAPNEVKSLSRIENNLQHKDSLKLIFEELKNDFDINMVLQDNEKIGLLVLCGFYIEGLYIVTNVYNKDLSAKLLTRYMKKNLNGVIFQQQVLLSNMIELLGRFDDKDTQKMEAELESLYLIFEQMNISYKTDKEENITAVNIKDSDIQMLSEVVANIRNEII